MPSTFYTFTLEAEIDEEQEISRDLVLKMLSDMEEIIAKKSFSLYSSDVYSERD